jgi:ABC-type multidrug transport system fused ATPase/permease subunit
MMNFIRQWLRSNRGGAVDAELRLSSAELIFQLLDTGSKIHSPEDPVCIDLVKGEIRFEQVGFSYPEESGSSAPEKGEDKEKEQ